MPFPFIKYQIKTFPESNAHFVTESLILVMTWQNASHECISYLKDKLSFSVMYITYFSVDNYVNINFYLNKLCL